VEAEVTVQRYFALRKQWLVGGIWGERTGRPPAQILGHIGRGASHDAGRSRVSVRRSVQVLSGVVIRQRPGVGSRAVIPSPRLA
jgi:hypothetical protein